MQTGLLNSFVGRQKEVYAVLSSILKSRLTTVLGPPEVGKSAITFYAARYMCERLDILPTHFGRGSLENGCIWVDVREAETVFTCVCRILERLVYNLSSDDTGRPLHPMRRGRDRDHWITYLASAEEWVHTHVDSGTIRRQTSTPSTQPKQETSYLAGQAASAARTILRLERLENEDKSEDPEEVPLRVITEALHLLLLLLTPAKMVLVLDNVDALCGDKKGERFEREAARASGKRVHNTSIVDLAIHPERAAFAVFLNLLLQHSHELHLVLTSRQSLNFGPPGLLPGIHTDASNPRLPRQKRVENDGKEEETKKPESPKAERRKVERSGKGFNGFENDGEKVERRNAEILSLTSDLHQLHKYGEARVMIGSLRDEDVRALLIKGWGREFAKVTRRNEKVTECLEEIVKLLHKQFQSRPSQLQIWKSRVVGILRDQDSRQVYREVETVLAEVRQLVG